RNFDENGNELEHVDWGQIEYMDDRPIKTTTTWQDVGGTAFPNLYRPQDQTVAYASGDADATRSVHYGYNFAGDLTDVWGDLDGVLPLLRHHQDPAKAIALPPPDASSAGPHRIQLAHFDVDSYGNVHRTQEPGGRCRDTNYDEYQALPINVEVYTNGCDGR